MIKKCQILNDDESVKINHKQNCLYIPKHPCRILIIGGSGSDKTDALLNKASTTRC